MIFFSEGKNNHIIDKVYYLQNYKGGWENGEFREKMNIEECNRPPPYHKENENLYQGQFWRFNQVRAKELDCVSILGRIFLIIIFL